MAPSKNPTLQLIVDIGEPRTHPARDRKRGTPDGCAHCGERHWNCSGHSQRTGRPCNHNPMRGQTKCFLHGGRSPQAMAAAKKRVAKKEAIELLGTLQFVVNNRTTVAKLEAAIDRAAAWYDECYANVQALDGEYIVEETEKFGGKKLAVHPTVMLRNQALETLMKFLIATSKLGLDVQRLQLEKKQGDRIFGAFIMAIEATGLSDEQAETMRMSFAAALQPQGELTP